MGIIAGIAIPTTIAVINRQKKNAAIKSAQNVFDTAKTLLMEAAANPSNTEIVGDGKVEKAGSGTSSDPYTYTVSVGYLVTSGELEKNPFDGDDADEAMEVTMNASTNKFTVSLATGATINSVAITASDINATATTTTGD